MIKNARLTTTRRHVAPIRRRAAAIQGQAPTHHRAVTLVHTARTAALEAGLTVVRTMAPILVHLNQPINKLKCNR